MGEPGEVHADRDVRMEHELDAGDRPGGERAAHETHLLARSETTSTGSRRSRPMIPCRYIDKLSSDSLASGMMAADASRVQVTAARAAARRRSRAAACRAAVPR